MVLSEPILDQKSLPGFWAEVGEPRILNFHGSCFQAQDAKAWAAQTYAYLQIPDRTKTGSDAKRTLQVASYLCATPDLLKAARKLNDAKDACKVLITSIGKLSSDELAEGQKQPLINVARRNNAVREMLAREGEGDISLGHLYRHITVIEGPVTKLRWRYNTKPSVTEISRDAALAEVEALQAYNRHQPYGEELNAALAPQWDALARLPGNAPLVKLRQLSRSLHVHPIFTTVKTNSRGKPLYPAFPGALPVLISHQTAPPTVSLPEEGYLMAANVGRLRSLRSREVAPSIHVWWKGES